VVWSSEKPESRPPFEASKDSEKDEDEEDEFGVVEEEAETFKDGKFNY